MVALGRVRTSEELIAQIRLHPGLVVQQGWLLPVHIVDGAKPRGPSGLGRPLLGFFLRPSTIDLFRVAVDLIGAACRQCGRLLGGRQVIIRRRTVVLSAGYQLDDRIGVTAAVHLPSR